MSEPAGEPSTSAALSSLFERRSEWLDALIILATVAVAFVVLGFLAAYFESYFRIILIFFLAWLLAFLLSPAADFLQRRLKRLPRPVAVIAVLVPSILVGAIVVAHIVATIACSFAEFATALPGPIADPPSFLSDIQAWFDQQGMSVDVVGTFESIVTGLLDGMAQFMLSIFGGVIASVSTFIDAIIVISLAVFMAIDRDRILRFGLDLTPPEHRKEALLFRRSIVAAFAGFIRSQLVLGALYGVWALLVCFVFGLPFAAVSRRPVGPDHGHPHLRAVRVVDAACHRLLVRPELAVPVAVVMLIGWFIDENILAPLVRAGALELHPIVVTFAFLLGAQLAGATVPSSPSPFAVVQAFFYYLKDYRAKRGWPAPDDAPADGAAPPGSVATASAGPSAS